MGKDLPSTIDKHFQGFEMIRFLENRIIDCSDALIRSKPRIVNFGLSILRTD